MTESERAAICKLVAYIAEELNRLATATRSLFVLISRMPADAPEPEPPTGDFGPPPDEGGPS